MQARSQTMNTAGAAASRAGAHMYVGLYTHVMLYYTYTVYVSITHKHKRRVCQEHKIDTLIT